MADAQHDDHTKRLFAGACVALIPTGAAFALIGNVLGQLKTEFILTNSQVGLITGASVGAMAIALLVLGPLLEGYGLKKGLALAFTGHIVGLTTFLAASLFSTSNPTLGIWLLSIGAIILACGNGMVEVVGNPLVAALHPNDKATKLNLWHGFFPLAIFAAGIIGYFLKGAPGFASDWVFQLSLVYIPIIIYGLMVLPLRFPNTENTDAGLPVKEMFRYTFTKPLMYGILLLMCVAISLELGTGRWVPAIFNRIGVPGILLLSWYSLVMFVLRFFAGPFIHRLSPPGVLSIASIFTAIGLLVYSQVPEDGIFLSFVAATCFGIGIAYYFPTIVGLVSERLPRTGSLGIVLTCGVGLGAAGFLGQPGIGMIADTELAGYLNREKPERTVAVLRAVDNEFPAFADEAEQASAQELSNLGYRAAGLRDALGETRKALESYEKHEGKIADSSVPQALRAIKGAAVSTDPDKDPGDQAKQLLNPEEGEPASPEKIGNEAAKSPVMASALAAKIIGPAEGYGGQQALLWISWTPLILVVCFGAMYLRDKAQGGYQAGRLTSDSAESQPGSAEQAAEPAGAGSSSSGV